MAKRPINRGASFHVRVPEKTRYGADLLCRRYATNPPHIIERALNDLFAKEGLLDKEPGDFSTLLDKLWAPSLEERIYRLSVYAPDLLDENEREVLQWLKELGEQEGRPFGQDEIIETIAKCVEKRGATE